MKKGDKKSEEELETRSQDRRSKRLEKISEIFLLLLRKEAMDSENSG